MLIGLFYGDRFIFSSLFVLMFCFGFRVVD